MTVALFLPKELSDKNLLSCPPTHAQLPCRALAHFQRVHSLRMIRLAQLVPFLSWWHFEAMASWTGSDWPGWPAAICKVGGALFCFCCTASNVRGAACLAAQSRRVSSVYPLPQGGGHLHKSNVLYNWIWISKVIQLNLEGNIIRLPLRVKEGLVI
jgi:hypothetical protein